MFSTSVSSRTRAPLLLEPLDLLLEHLGRRPHVRVEELQVGLGEPAAEPVALLHQGHREALDREIGGRLDAGDAAADHQAARVIGASPSWSGSRWRARATPMRISARALSWAASGVLGVHPRALVADVDHLEQVGVEADPGQGLAEDRLVGPRRAGGDHDPVELVLA